MIKFLRTVLAVVVGFFVVSVLIFSTLFGMIEAFSSTFSPEKTEDYHLPKGDLVLEIDLNMSLIEHPRDHQPDLNEINPFEFPSSSLTLQKMMDAIAHAKEDEQVKGISLKFDGLHGGITNLDNLRSALEDFKTSGKPIYAYGNQLSQKEYYIASLADELYMHPAGGVGLQGMGTAIQYYKKFFDIYGFKIHVVRHGKYKSFGEPYLRERISEENYSQTKRILDNIWSDVSAKMAASRGLSYADFQASTDRLDGIFPEQAVKNKLVTALMQEGEYMDHIEKVFKNEDEATPRVGLKNYIKTLDKSKSKKDKIAIIYATGIIKDGGEAEEIHGNYYKKLIRKIKDDKEVKAVVLRVNSPGGSANASDEILFELKRLEIPVVVSFGNIAASGGYYIAMAGERIFCEKNCVIGSIGVFGIMPDFKEIAQKHGVHTDVVGTNAHSTPMGALSLAGVSKNELDIVQKSVDGIYKRFVQLVSENRNMTYEQVDAIAQGRVWSGVDALKVGLVDELGTLNDAIAYAAKSADVEEYSLKSYPKQKNDFRSVWKQLMQPKPFFNYLIKNYLGQEWLLLKEINSQKTPTVLMREDMSVAL